MKVSLVVPTLNQGRYIRECLESVRRQTHRDFEVLIQDAGSTDETERICREFAAKDSRFDYRREADLGQSDAINRGLARSSGTLWNWLCSDDYFDSEFALQSLTERFSEGSKRDSGFIGVFGNARMVDARSAHLLPYLQKRKDLTRDDFINDWPLAQPSSLLLRSEVARAGGVDPVLQLGMDLDLFLTVLTAGKKLIHVDAPVACARDHALAKSLLYPFETARTALALVQKHTGSPGDLSRSVYYKNFLIYRNGSGSARRPSYPFARKVFAAVKTMRGPLAPPIISAAFALKRLKRRYDEKFAFGELKGER